MNREVKLAGHYVKRYWLWYVLGIVSLTAVDALVVYLPKITGQIVGGLEKNTVAMDQILRLLIRMVSIAALVALGRFGWRFFFFGASRSVERDLRNDLFGHLETLSMRYFNEHKTGDLMAHFTSDLQSIRQLLGMTIITAFDATVELILVLTNMITYVDWRLTLVALTPLLLIIIGDIFFGKAMHRRFMEKQEAFSALTDQTQESISGIRVIKAFVQERKELYAFAKASLRCKDKNLAVARLVSTVFPLLDLVIGVSMMLTLLYGGKLAIDGEIGLDQFVVFNTYLTMLVWPLIAVGEAVSSISQGLASLKRVRRIHDAKPDIVDEGDPAVTSLSGAIELDGLSFAYPGAEAHPALTDVSLRVAPGETLAIIGRTGAGKTTLVNLIERLWDTERRDMIRFDGRSIREIPLSVLHRDIAYVPQDNFLFSDTVARNIAFGVEQAGQEEVEEAAKQACVHDNILEFPEGYETLVGERGVTVSGGQKQRTSIARALLKDAPILILDDALSAVDTDTEEQILHNLRETRRGRTTIIIAHRVSTIQQADHIAVLEDGRLAEYGTHDELLALQGIYRGIYDKQQLEKQLREEGGELHD
ncbi:MAG: ABC transporter ATP-binding protein [Clostridia bacterium]|nr:ABC transporter ATP-binding protein [Clostridia bacterium]